MNEHKRLYKIKRTLKTIGIDTHSFITFVKGLSSYFRDKKALTRQKGANADFPMGENYPIFNDKFSAAGIMSGHYFHQDLYVARKIFENNPQKHLDIGSRIDGFVAHVAIFREIDIVDIRPLQSKVKNVGFRQVDLMKLPEDMIGAYDSISSLHAIEHFGLGRYGDPIDYFGWEKALNNIYQILMKGGKFYFSVPIGKQRIEFNAQRVFSVAFLLKLFNENYTLNSFSYVNDNGDFYDNVELKEKDINNNFGCHYGCGIFELTKK
ncbi:hypothetical protein FACS189434_00490 [Bacteroidia bacterium]|nr:hypothetical protein FACS189434_00490 [Bacteroidia bacterium]